MLLSLRSESNLRIILNLNIFIFLIIFYFTKQIELYVTIIFFALIHEISHIIVGILYGLKAKTLKITPFGVSIYFEKYKKNGGRILEKQKIIIALAGPIMNLVIAFIIMFLPINLFVHVSQANLVYSNLLLAVFNLLPIYPLDGGRIIKSVLTLKNVEKKKKVVLTERISFVTLIILTTIFSILILMMQNLAIIMILAYLWFLVVQQIRYNKIRLRVYEIARKRGRFYFPR